MRIVRRWLSRISILAVALGATSVAFTVPASAALSPGCTQTAGTGNVTCTFTTTGEDPIIVPTGVPSFHVVAVGATPGNTGGGLGGHGSSVVADVPVTAGSTVYAEVNVGGGAAGGGGTAGGGASDLRTCSTSSVCGGLGTVADPRLVVAGGGGGAGAAGGGGNGGAGGAGVSTACNTAGNGGNGAAGTFRGGGGGGGSCVAGGAAGLGAGGTNGIAGAAGQGGAASGSGQGGGGGGGGYFGGGGGGGDGIPGNAGGGGGGSSFATSSATNVVMASAGSGTASLTVTFVRPIDHLVLTPATLSITDGTSQTFTVAAVDRDGNSLGDVTSASTLTISGGGTCTGATCTASGAGAHTVTATDGALVATATLTVPTAEVTAAAPTLPATGAGTGGLLTLGLVLLIAGVAALTVARGRAARYSLSSQSRPRGTSLPLNPQSQSG